MGELLATRKASSLAKWPLEKPINRFRRNKIAAHQSLFQELPPYKLMACSALHGTFPMFADVL